jgi:hypothetical protein
MMAEETAILETREDYKLFLEEPKPVNANRTGQTGVKTEWP